MMSAQEIIAELPGLTRRELEQLDERLHQLLRAKAQTPTKAWGDVLLELAGVAHGLPADFAANHDHYLHGSIRR